MSSGLVLCSKSTWEPAIRREHALAIQASQAGIDVSFVEAPADFRSARTGAVGWSRGLSGSRVSSTQPSVDVWRRTTIAPGHRSELSQRINTSLLTKTLRRLDKRDAVIVAMAPWDWPALMNVASVRRVYDCTDDWSRLIPGRRREIEVLFRRIAYEADAVTVTSMALAEHFRGREVSVVANAAERALVESPSVAPPGSDVMTYIGTLSERFDAALMYEVMSALPGWHLSLYGECRYAGEGSRPGAELRELLTAFPDRAHWNGPVGRGEIASKLDAADVLIIPNRPGLAVGQSSMKLYDYAARARPIVASAAEGLFDGARPPGVTIAPTAEEFAAAVVQGPIEDPRVAGARRHWISQHTWDQRWPVWSNAVFGGSRADAVVGRPW